MTHDNARGARGHGLTRVAGIALMLAVALSAHWSSPLTALAETGSTQLYVERATEGELADGGEGDADQKHATISSAQNSPQTGDVTDATLAATLAAGGAGVVALGYALRKRKRHELPTIPRGKARHYATRDARR